MNYFLDYNRILFNVNGIWYFLFLSNHDWLRFNISQHPVISLIQCDCWFMRFSGENINIDTTGLVRHIFANFNMWEVINFEV